MKILVPSFKNNQIQFFMELDLYQVDAFTSKPFEGNPAAVCPLEEWMPDELLQKIAMENNLSETAFFMEEGNGYRLRWFTPEAEVDLCGHATLASAHVLFEHLGYAGEEILFHSNSGELKVSKGEHLLVMDFPQTPGSKVEPPELLLEAMSLDASVAETYRATDYMMVLGNQSAVEKLDPDYQLLKQLKTRGIIVSAPSDSPEYDFVSRFFAPALAINEDPVTGSAHTMMAPFWADRFGKKNLKARQISRRGGDVHCTVLRDRVELGGQAVTYLQGTVRI